MTRHIFHSIDELFRPNDKDDTSREEPGDAAWSTQKFVLEWKIDIVKQVLTLLEDCKRNLLSLLNTIPPSASRCSQRRWHKLLGTLRITVPTIAGTAGMFTRLQYALRMAKGRRINLST